MSFATQELWIPQTWELKICCEQSRTKLQQTRSWRSVIIKQVSSFLANFTRILDQKPGCAKVSKGETIPVLGLSMRRSWPQCWMHRSRAKGCCCWCCYLPLFPLPGSSVPCGWSSVICCWIVCRSCSSVAYSNKKKITEFSFYEKFTIILRKKKKPRLYAIQP